MPSDRPARDATTTAGQRWLDELTRDARRKARRTGTTPDRKRRNER